MTNFDFSKIKNLLQSSKNIVIVPHKNPDGDAIGSVLGAYHYFTLKGHRAKVVSPNDYPDFLKWMPGTECVLKFDMQNSQSKRWLEKADLIFLMDFNDLSRVGDDMQKTLEKCMGTFVMIDHHQQPSPITPYIFSDTSVCATAQMFYHFLEKLEDTDSITSEIATCLYAGILTDTGSFRFPSTTPTTHKIAAKLIEKGAQNAAIYNQIFDQNSLNRLQLLGQALQNLVVLDEFKTAYITLTKEEKNRYNFQKGDSEGVVNYALSVKNVVLGVIFIEDEEQEIVKISFRSKGTFNVNQFSRDHFEGGGHINAAGGRSNENITKTIQKFINLLPKYKSALEQSYE